MSRARSPGSVGKMCRMRVLGRLIAGGLVGFAVILFAIGHSQWPAHAVAAVVSVLAVVLGSHRGAGLWNAVPLIALVVVFFVSWF